jgi:hypothetical protein
MAPKPKVRGPARNRKKVKTKEKPQRERFIEAARAIGVDESGKEFEQLFERVVAPKRQRTTKP